MLFWDCYLPSKVAGVGFVGAPRFKTTIQVSSGGGERANREWEHPLRRFIAPEATRQWDVVEDLLDHWLLAEGPYWHFPLREPFDFASSGLTRPNVIPTVAMTNQSLGTGNGFTDSFQLVKRYSRGGRTYDRKIHLPVLSSVLIADNGALVNSADYTVTRPGGVVTFDIPPLAGHVLTAGFLFDCEVRFESDDQLEQIMRATKVAGFADLTLIEVRPC